MALTNQLIYLVDIKTMRKIFSNLHRHLHRHLHLHLHLHQHLFLFSFFILFLFQGVPVDETTTDGRTCKTTVTMEGDNKMIEFQKAQKKGQKDVTVIREFSDKGIDVQIICEDVTSVWFCERI